MELGTVMVRTKGELRSQLRVQLEEPPQDGARTQMTGGTKHSFSEVGRESRSSPVGNAAHRSTSTLNHESRKSRSMMNDRWGGGSGPPCTQLIHFFN